MKVVKLPNYEKDYRRLMDELGREHIAFYCENDKMNAEKKREHRKLGLCTQCSAKAVKDRTMCEKHRLSHLASCEKYNRQHPEYYLKLSREKRERRRKNKQCISCGADLHEEADSGHVKCTNCRQNLHGISYVQGTNWKIPKRTLARS